MRRPILTLLLAAAFSLPAQAEVKNIDNEALKALMAQGVPIIDIRRPDEWKQTGVVKGSHLNTFFDRNGRYDVRAWLAKLAPIAGKDDPFILICRTGNRTGTVSRFLDQKLGYKKVYNVQRGITDWIRKGNPVVQPDL
jgi:rhodanese-related sulfurtransferase